MVEEIQKKKVLFICIFNAARSQMAEGLFRHLYGEGYDVYSAGSYPKEIDPIAIQVMDEIGVDISKQKSKSLKEFEGQEFDYVITVCGSPFNACPLFVGGKKYFKRPFEDLSTFNGTEQEKIELFTRLRDELKDWIEHLYTKNIQKTSYNTANDECCDEEINDEVNDICSCNLGSSEDKEPSCR